MNNGVITMTKRWVIVAVIIPALIIAVAAIYSMRRDRCTPVFGAPANPAQSARESQELFSAMQLLWRNEHSTPRHTILIVHNGLPLPQPLKADVAASTATVTLRGKLYSGDFRYADAWYKVYNVHHPAHHCVHMRLQWNDGHIEETYPISEF